MKVIDLINRIANGEEVPKRIRIDHWCYEFEWVEHNSNYYDKHEDIDLMSCLSMDKEELNYEVHELKEEKKIPEKIGLINYCEDQATSLIHHKVDEIIDYLDYLKSKGE